LQIAAVTYLKSLDEMHDERAARLAADHALAECRESRRPRPDIYSHNSGSKERTA
jgi:hypothetical protein